MSEEILDLTAPGDTPAQMAAPERPRPPSRADRLRTRLRSPHALPLGLVAGLVLALIAPTFHTYMWYGHERFHSVVRVRELCRLWAVQGPFHAPWLPDICFGQGWPFFTFYAPLGYYAAAFFHFIFGLDYGAATRWSFYASLALAALLMYGLAWRLGGERAGPRRRWWALAAATVYTLAPYHLTDIFARQSLAECWVWAVLPGLFLALEASRRRTLAGILLVGLATAALVLSHNIMALYGVLLVAVYTLLTAQTWRWPLVVAAGGALGLALSAYFWLPALALKGLTPANNPDRMFGSARFLRAHAVCWQQFFIERLGKGQSVRGWRDQLGIDLGIGVGLSLLLGAAALCRPTLERFRRRRILTALGLVGGLLFAVSPAMPWEHVPGLLRYVQFPWRLLLLTSFLGALTLGWAAPAAPRWLSPFVLIGLAAALGLGGAYRSLYEAPPKMSDEELPQWIAKEERAYIFAGCQAGEYLPLTAAPALMDYRYQEKAPAPPGRLTVLAGPLVVEQFRHHGASYLYQYRAETAARALVHVFYFPGWSLWIDGQEQERRVRLFKPNGYVELLLPPGEHTAELRYGLSPVGRAARWVSVAGWITVLGLLWALRRRRA